MEGKYGIPYDANLQKQFIDRNDVSSYDYLPEIPRLYYKSHIFGGSHVREPRKSNIFDYNQGKIINKVITTPKLLERMFLEVLSNAIDNVYKSRRMGVDPGSVEITMDAMTISVKNGGIPIPVGLHKYFIKQGQYGTAAELIFGVIGAGSNTSESVIKQGGGQNGYGAKLVNVFSQEFSIEICDNIRGFRELVQWSHNMTQKDSVQVFPSNYTLQDNYIEDIDIYGRRSVINVPNMIPNPSDKYTGENSVTIKWKQDFRKMGCNCYSEDELMLYMRFALEASFHSKVPIIFNGKAFNYQNVNDFMKLFNTGTTNQPIIHYEWPNGYQPQYIGKSLDTMVSTGQLTPVLELVIFDTPDNGQHISYCNGIYNVDGGVHTNTAYQEVLKVIKEVISSTKGFDKSGLDLAKITIADLKKHLTVIINFRCDEPTFKGQDKESLLKPTPKINIPIDSVAKIKKWKVVDRIYTTLTGKHINTAGGKSDSSKRIKDDYNFEEANWIGTNRTAETVLIFCEGESAGSYVLNWILATEERKNKFAILPLKGKLRNITDLSILEVEQCKEIARIIKYSGLKYGVDYTTPDGVSKLKYGMLYGMTDADSDGSHIQSLIFNVIYRLFPTMILANRVFYIPTPVIRIINNKDVTEKIFYNMFDYERWAKENPNSNKRAKYLKGLASNKKEFAKQDAQISPIVVATFDSAAGQALDIAFRRGLTYQRKQWINFWRDKIDQNILHQINAQHPRYAAIELSMYINTKLVEYSIDSFSRALPSYKDGLKKSQRQLLHYLLQNWNFGHSRKTEVKLKDIASAASTECKYHHGDLGTTLARMGTCYPGANNVPLIVQEGAFGSRNKLGADVGADRYVETKPDSIIKFLFSEELYNMVERNLVEDKKVEPKWIPSYGPIHLWNGWMGIATAHSSEHPPYHPVDTIDWLMCYITGNNPFPLIPWFKGFTGEVKLESFKGRYTKEQRFLMQGQENIPYYQGLTVCTTGIYRVLGVRQGMIEQEVNGKKQSLATQVTDIEITEIPIDVATSKFRFELEQNCDKIIDDMKDTDSVHMFVQGWRGEVNDKTLGMKKRIGMTNITLIDDNAFPISLKNVYEVLKLYADNMIDLFIKLKQKRLTEITEKITYKSKVIKILELILSKQLVYIDVDDSYIAQQLAQYQIEFEIYEKLYLKSISKNGLEKHRKELAELQEQYKVITDRHHLQDWIDALNKLRDIFNSNKEYQKLPHHVYPYVYTPIEKLLDGTVKSPYRVTEEALPLSI